MNLSIIGQETVVKRILVAILIADPHAGASGKVLAEAISSLP